MFGQAVLDGPHAHVHPCRQNILAKGLRAIGRSKNGLGNVAPDLARIDVEGSHHANILRGEATDPVVHKSDGIVGRVVTVVMDTLYERTGAVSHADDRKFYFGHVSSSSRVFVPDGYRKRQFVR